VEGVGWFRSDVLANIEDLDRFGGFEMVEV